MFRLHKWYMDAVFGDGAAFIGYAARARICGVPLRHTSVLMAPPSGRAAERVARAPCPVFHGNVLQWKAPRLGVEGHWRGVGSCISRTLLESDEGTIQWRCCLPRADARVTIGEECLRGAGYAEELLMTIAPWRMPFRSLRWGRFFSPNHTVVWIDWRDGLERTWVFHNAAWDAGARVDDYFLQLSAGTLQIQRVAPLRDASIADTAFGRARFLKRLLPNGWSAARETKFLSPATLTCGTATEIGYALHEVCTWQ